MRETAAHGRLEGECAASHVPTAVFQLGLQKVFEPSAIFRRFRFNSGRVQREETQPGRVGVALQFRELRPAAIGALFLDEPVRELLHRSRSFASPGQAEELISAFFGVRRVVPSRATCGRGRCVARSPCAAPESRRF